MNLHRSYPIALGLLLASCSTQSTRPPTVPSPIRVESPAVTPSDREVREAHPDMFSTRLVETDAQLAPRPGYPDLEAMREAHNREMISLVRRLLTGEVSKSLVRDPYLGPQPTQLSDEGAAYLLLATADMVAPHGMGEGGSDSPGAEAFAALLHRGSRDLFEQLAIRGITHAGKAYGMAGLYLTDRDRFDQLAQLHYEGNVHVMYGCLVSPHDWSSVLDGIRNGLADQLAEPPSNGVR